MTYPRRLLPGTTHAITRRVTRRCFLLKPTPFVNEVVLYCLAVAAQRYGGKVAIHAFSCQANHCHMNATDTHVEGELSSLPDFKRDMNSNIARALNAHYGRGEQFWCSGSYSNTEIHSQPSMERQLLYVWTQAVKDGLVERPEDWLGVQFLPEDIGKIIFVRKPEGAFFGTRRPKPQPAEHELALEPWQHEVLAEQQEAEAELHRRIHGDTPKRRRRPRPSRSKLPAIVSFRIAVPPGYEDWEIEDVRKHFRKLLDAEVERIHAERRAQGKGRFMGMAAVLAQDPHASAGPTWPSFELNPRVACSGDLDRYVEVLAGFKAWRADYRVAYECLRDGRRATFPPGTYGRLRFPRAVRARTRPPDRVAA